MRMIDLGLPPLERGRPRKYEFFHHPNGMFEGDPIGTFYSDTPQVYAHYHLICPKCGKIWGSLLAYARGDDKTECEWRGYETGCEKHRANNNWFPMPIQVRITKMDREVALYLISNYWSPNHGN